MLSKAGHAEDLVSRHEYDVVPRNYHSPIPHLEELPEDIWERRSPLAGGIELNLDRAIEVVETELSQYFAELDFPIGPRPPGKFFLRNENFESVDAELLYGIVRARTPRRVLELGSGYTTLLIALAARRNAEQGSPTEHVAYDLYPRAHVIGDAPPPPTRLEQASVLDVPLAEFRRLAAGDVLFVDTTHTVKLGGDVNYLVLDVLPELAPGVIIHFHDIFLPWEYPRAWLEEMQYYWAEQYLLQAFLAHNDAFEVLLPAYALSREYPDRVVAAVPSYDGTGLGGASFWLVRR